MLKLSMEKYRYMFCMVIMFIVTLKVYSQGNYKIEYIDSISDEYPKNMELCTSSITKINFKLNSKNDLYSNVEVSEEMVTLKNNHFFIKNIFFDENSGVVDFSVFNSKGKKQNVESVMSDVQIQGVFYHDAKKVSIEKDFENKGEEFTFYYLKNYTDPKYFNRIFFNDSYPILRKEIVFFVPKWLEIEILEMNFKGYNIYKEIKETHVGKEIKYIATELPPLDEKPYSPPIAKSYPHLVILMKSYENNDDHFSILSNVDDLFSYYIQLYSQVNNESENLQSFVEDLLNECETEMCKIETLFYWVQDNIRYIAFENGIMGFKPEGAYQVFYNRYGDCKGKANLLKEMLILAGFDAKLGWIGTRSIPYDYSIPSLLVDNHMICVLDFDGNRYFLDATEEYIPINEYAQRIQGRQVLFADGNSYIIDTVPAELEIYSGTTKEFSCSYDNDKLVGVASVNYSGELKTSFLRNYHTSNTSLREEQFNDFLENYNNNIRIVNVQQGDFDDRSIPIQIDYNFEVSNKVFNINNSVYLNLEFDKELFDMTIDTTRIIDFDLQQSQYFVTNGVMEIPESYYVDYLPSNVSISRYSYEIDLSYSVSDKIILYSKKIYIIDPLIRKKDFNDWNSSINKLREFYNDQIVLKKIDNEKQ